jgi:hypothetical protein
MSRKGLWIVGFALLFAVSWRTVATQTPGLPTLEPQEGIFVTPIAGQPLSATVTIEVKRELRDGSIWQRTATAVIARNSQGQIHNEAHAFVPLGLDRKPASTLMSVHIYDPQTRLNTFLNPSTHIARQRTLAREPSTAPPANWAQMDQRFRPSTNVQLEDLGTQTIEGFYVHGYRRTNTYDAQSTGTGRSIVVTDEYWYAEDIRLNLLEKHNDPRKGDFTTTVTQVNRTEPAAELFVVPAGFKIVDVTPEN